MLIAVGQVKFEFDGSGGNMPHYTEYEFPKTNILFANGWASGRTLLLLSLAVA